MDVIIALSVSFVGIVCQCIVLYYGLVVSSLLYHTVYLQIFVAENFHNFRNYMILRKLYLQKFSYDWDHISLLPNFGEFVQVL